MHKHVIVPFRYERKVEPYLAAARSAGLEPVKADVVTANPTLGYSHALILTGGTDVDPALWGAEPHEEAERPDPERDTFELTLLAEAMQRRIPILAICRGLQLLNVARGGTLNQHLASPLHDVETEDRGLAAHAVKVVPGTLLNQILGATTVEVNSRHHQAIDRLGRGLLISALDPLEGIVECVEDQSYPFLVGVQWHPEDQVNRDERQLRLFGALGEAAESFAGSQGFEVKRSA